MSHAKNIHRSVQIGLFIVTGILLNQQYFIPGETLDLSVEPNPFLSGMVYIFLVHPDGIIHTLISTGLTKPNEILPYEGVDFPSPDVEKGTLPFS